MHDKMMLDLGFVQMRLMFAKAPKQQAEAVASLPPSLLLPDQQQQRPTASIAVAQQ